MNDSGLSTSGSRDNIRPATPFQPVFEIFHWLTTKSEPQHTCQRSWTPATIEDEDWTLPCTSWPPWLVRSTVQVASCHLSSELSFVFVRLFSLYQLTQMHTCSSSPLRAAVASAILGSRSISRRQKQSLSACSRRTGRTLPLAGKSSCRSVPLYPYRTQLSGIRGPSRHPTLELSGTS